MIHYLLRHHLRLCLLWLSLATIFEYSNAQTPPQVQLPQVIPPSPQAAIFNKYLNHEISDYNGLPQIEIPLYEIEIKGLKIPITLSYHAGGVKYLQYDGDIGAGWSISAGGYGITRTIKGKDDMKFLFYDEQKFRQLVINQAEGMKGYIGYNAALSMEYTDEIVYHHCMDSQNFVDGEYDLFNYMTPGGSGQFIITGRDYPSTRMIINSNPENKVLTSGTPALSLNDMTVVDGNGFIYYMGKHPTQGNIYEEGPIARSDNRTGWPLRQIKSPYNETIEFSYVNHNISHDREDYFWDDYYTFNVGEAIKDEASDEFAYANYNFNSTFADSYGSLYRTYFVSEIRTNKEVIEFVRYAPNSQTAHVIKEIRIRNLSGNLVKTILFEYNTSGLHRLLSKLSVSGQEYRFDYYPEPTGAYNRLYSDVWGYYKVSTQQNSWMNYLDERYKDDEILFQSYNKLEIRQIIKKLKDITEWQGLITWVNRESNGETTHAFSLKKITFPTGGTTEYVYEPNRYKDYYQSGTPIISGAGQRIQKITSKAGNGTPAITTVFSYGKEGNGYADITHFNWGSAIHNYASKINNYTLYSRPEGFVYYRNYELHGTYRTYSSRRPLQNDADSNPPIIYSQVTKCQYDKQHNILDGNGKTVSYYTPSREMPYETLEGHHDGITYQYISQYCLGKKAMPDSICVFNNNGLVYKEAYTYTGDGINTKYGGVRVKIRTQIQDETFNRDGCIRPDYLYTPEIFSYTRNNYSIVDRIPTSKTVTVYDGGIPTTITETYEYNARNQRIRTTQNNGQSGILVKEYTYPDSYSESVYAEMIAKNMVHPVIEQITKNNNVETERIKISYNKTQGLILPGSVQSSAGGSLNLQTAITYDLYDAQGNIRQYTSSDDQKTTVLWGYNGNYPIAEIKHATYSEVEAAANAIGLNLNTLLTDNLPNMMLVNSLRQRLSNALVTTLTYKPLIGVASVTDPSGKTTFYEYDTHNRLKEVYILNNTLKEVLSAYKYNYINQ